MRKTFSSLILAAFFAASSTQAVIVADVGSGSDMSNLYLQFANPLYEAVHIRYFYDYSEAAPITGAQMIYNIVASSGSGLSIIDNGEALTFGGFLFVYEFQYGSSSEYGDFASDATWNYYVAGGENVAYNPDTFIPIWGPGGEGDYTFNSISDGAWVFAPVGASDRVITPGSWDGYVFGDWMAPPAPDIAPIPEPSTIALLGLCVIWPLVRRLRQGRSEK